MIKFTEKGIYCVPGKFYIDPWKPVAKAVITHAHSDHARPGMKHYLAHHDSVPVMRYRLGEDIKVRGVAYNEPITVGGVKVSLHPAGHILGSAQVRVEYKGEVWVVTGDYKLSDDGLCPAYEPVTCHHFLTESTFGLPVFRWQPQAEILHDINQWWRDNAERGVASVIFAYSLGKAQRIINNVDQSVGPIFTHGAIENTNEVLRQAGHEIAPTTLVTPELKKAEVRHALVVAPPSAFGSTWIRRLQPYETAMASGWMMVRGMRRRRNADRGFVLSDHADWDELIQAVKLSEAENIYVTHGYASIFSRYLTEQGWNAQVVQTNYDGEGAELGGTADD